MNGIKEYKSSLERYAKPYMEELYQNLVDAHLVNTPVKEAKIETKESDESNWPVARRIISQLYDLRTVMQVVHPGLSTEATPKSFMAYLKFFNDREIINVPLSDPRLQSLFDNINNYDEENFSEEWLKALTENKIDLIHLSLIILENYSKEVIERVGKKYDFVYNPELREYKDKGVGLTVKQDHSKVILLDIKYRYRSSSMDLKNIFMRGIEKLKEYQLQYKYTTKYLLILLYTDRQEHELGKLIAQFNSLLLASDQSLLKKVFFIPATLHKIGEVEVKVEDCLKSITGQEVSFDYEGSVFSNGWQAAGLELRRITNMVGKVNTKIYGKALRLSLPVEETKIRIVYGLSDNETWRPSNALFTIRPFDGYRLYVHFTLRGNDQVYTIKLVAGDQEPELLSLYEIVEYIPLEKGEDWQLIRVNILDILERGFKMDRRNFRKIHAVSLGGVATIARIQFE